MVRESGRSRGCEACRQKKIKCDEAEPECGQCLRRGTKCPGALRGLIIFETKPKDPRKFRRLADGREEPANSISPASVDLQLTRSVPSSGRALESGTPDPFFSMAAPLSERTNAHFQHFMVHTVRCCWPFRPEVLGVWFGQQATTQPALFYGLISMSASHRFHLDDNHQINHPEANQWMLQALEYRARIIQGVQQTVNNIATSDIKRIAILVAMLICMEAANANLPEVDIHMAGLQKLVELCGGIDSLDIETISFFTGIDLLRAIVRCNSPALPLSPKYAAYARSHPAISISSYHLPLEDLSHSPGGHIFPALGSRFNCSAWAGVLDRPLRVTIQNFCNLIVHYEADEQRPVRDKVIEYRDNDPWSLSQYYLVTLGYEHLGPCDIREPLRRSMLAYSLTRYCRFGEFPCMDVIAGTLRDSLTPRMHTFLSTAPDLLFWTLYVGALTAREISDHYWWYCAKLARVCSSLGLTTWNDARSLLEQFFYVHRPSEGSAERVWRHLSSPIIHDDWGLF